MKDHPAAALFQHSAFAHGFMHGYEDGFHCADLDLHMSRPARKPSSFSEYKKADSGFDSSFGEKHLFQAGYRAGFNSGYNNGYSEQPFRGVAEARAAAQGLQPEGKPSKSFDRAFGAGFTGGLKRAQHDAQPIDVDLSQTIDHCRSSMPDKASTDTLQFCNAFGRGYRMGYMVGEQRSEEARTRVPH
jgi:hypothetical protein